MFYGIFWPKRPIFHVWDNLDDVKTTPRLLLAMRWRISLDSADGTLYYCIRKGMS